MRPETRKQKHSHETTEPPQSTTLTQNNQKHRTQKAKTRNTKTVEIPHGGTRHVRIRCDNHVAQALYYYCYYYDYYYYYGSGGRWQIPKIIFGCVGCQQWGTTDNRGCGRGSSAINNCAQFGDGRGCGKDQIYGGVKGIATDEF